MDHDDVLEALEASLMTTWSAAVGDLVEVEVRASAYSRGDRAFRAFDTTFVGIFLGEGYSPDRSRYELTFFRGTDRPPVRIDTGKVRWLRVVSRISDAEGAGASPAEDPAETAEGTGGI